MGSLFIKGHQKPQRRTLGEKPVYLRMFVNIETSLLRSFGKPKAGQA
jgi:hypothetical protein